MITTFEKFLDRKFAQLAESGNDDWAARWRAMQAATPGLGNNAPAVPTGVTPPTAQDNSPAAQYHAMRAQAGFGDRQAVSQYKPDVTYGAQQGSMFALPGFSAEETDSLRKGLEPGANPTVVPDSIVRKLKLNSTNSHFVANSNIIATMHGRAAYPFAKERRAGQATGQIQFVPGYGFSTMIKNMGLGK